MKKAAVWLALTALASCAKDSRDPVKLSEELTGSRFGDRATVLKLRDGFTGEDGVVRPEGILEVVVQLPDSEFARVLAEQRTKGIQAISPSDSSLGDLFLLTRSTPGGLARIEYGSDSANSLLVVMDTSQRTLRVRYNKISGGW